MTTVRVARSQEDGWSMTLTVDDVDITASVLAESVKVDLMDATSPNPALVHLTLVADNLYVDLPEEETSEVPA